MSQKVRSILCDLQYFCAFGLWNREQKCEKRALFLHFCLFSLWENEINFDGQTFHNHLSTKDTRKRKKEIMMLCKISFFLTKYTIENKKKLINFYFFLFFSHIIFFIFSLSKKAKTKKKLTNNKIFQ